MTQDEKLALELQMKQMQYKKIQTTKSYDP